MTEEQQRKRIIGTWSIAFRYAQNLGGILAFDIPCSGWHCLGVRILYSVEYYDVFRVHQRFPHSHSCMTYVLLLTTRFYNVIGMHEQ